MSSWTRALHSRPWSLNGQRTEQVMSSWTRALHSRPWSLNGQRTEQVMDEDRERWRVLEEKRQEESEVSRQSYAVAEGKVDEARARAREAEESLKKVRPQTPDPRLEVLNMSIFEEARARAREAEESLKNV
jgi:hypothetical protein